MINGHRVVRELFLALAPLGEDHLEGRVEQQETARNPEGGQGNAQGVHQRGAAQRENEKDGEGDDAGADGDSALLLGRHPQGQCDEDRREPRRVQRHEKRDEGRLQKIRQHGLRLRAICPFEIQRPRRLCVAARAGLQGLNHARRRNKPRISSRMIAPTVAEMICSSRCALR